MKLIAIVGALVVCAIAASAAPAFGEDRGTVSARVTVASACIEVSPGELDFGVEGFTRDSRDPEAATRAVTATNCSPASSSLLARGTNATSAEGTTWVIQPEQQEICAATNRYTQRIGIPGISFPLTSDSNITIRTLAGSEAAALTAFVVMPCTGSDGGGETMTFSYIFTAVQQ